MTARPGLNKEKVLQAAVQILQADGLDGLTLSRLAQALGVRIPSLYNHIDGLEGLKRDLALLSVQRLGDRLSESALGRSGAEAVMSLAQAYRGFVAESPALYLAGVPSAAFQPDPELQAAQARVVNVALAVMRSFGLEGEAALHAVRGLRSLAHGFASLEIAGGFGLPLDYDESYRRLVEMFIQGLSSGRWPA